MGRVGKGIYSLWILSVRNLSKNLWVIHKLRMEIIQLVTFLSVAYNAWL